MIRFVPLIIMLIGLPLVWRLNPPWKWLIALSIVGLLFAYKIFVNPKYYK